MALPVIGMLIARAAAAVAKVGTSAGGAVARGAGAVSQGVRRVAARGTAAIAQRAANVQRGVGNAIQQGRQNLGRSFQRALNGPGSGRRGRSRRRRMPTVGRTFGRAVRSGAIKAARQSRAGNNVISRMFAPKSFLGRISRNLGSAQMNFRQGNNVQGTIDSLKVMHDIGKPLAKMNLAVLATVTALVSMPKVLKDFGASVIESKRHLGEMNAVYSISAGRLDLNRFQRNLRLGNATSGSFRSLTESQNRLEDKLMPYAIMGTNALYKIVTLLQEGARHGVTAVEYLSYLSKYKPVMDALAWWLSSDNGNNSGQPLAEFVRAARQPNFHRRQRPPMPANNGGAPPGARPPQPGRQPGNPIEV